MCIKPSMLKMGNFLWSSTVPTLTAISNSTDALWVVWLRVWLVWGWDVFIYLKVLWDNKTFFFKWGGDDGESADTSHLASLSKHSCQLSAPGLLHMTGLSSRCVSTWFPPPTLLGFPHETLHTSAGSPRYTWFLVHISQTCHREWIPGPRNNSGAGHSHSSDRLWFQVWSWAPGYM